MNEPRTCNIVAYVFDSLGYKNLAKHALEANSDDLDSYMCLLRKLHIDNADLRAIVTYFL